MIVQYSTARNLDLSVTDVYWYVTAYVISEYYRYIVS